MGGVLTLQDNIINTMDSNSVFTTEGHFIQLPLHLLQKQSNHSASASHRLEKAYTCPLIPRRDLSDHTSPPLLSKHQLEFIQSIVQKPKAAPAVPVAPTVHEPAQLVELKYVFEAFVNFLVFCAAYKTWKYVCSMK